MFDNTIATHQIVSVGVGDGGARVAEQQREGKKRIKIYPVGSAITNGREPKSCFVQVFNIKLGSFTYNTKIVQHANGHF